MKEEDVSGAQVDDIDIRSLSGFLHHRTNLNLVKKQIFMKAHNEKPDFDATSLSEICLDIFVRIGHQSRNLQMTAA